MKINVTRRDVLKFAAGGTVGVMMTPAPWKAVDDLAIWTQNWSWIPVTPKGPVTFRTTACSLCPAGCGVKARCIGGLPVSMQAAADPAGAGALCPLGQTGHHLPYHPSRLGGPARLIRRDGTRRRIPVTMDAVVAETTRAISAARSGAGSVAVLDMRPGRSTSHAWRAFLAAAPAGVFVPAPGRDGASLTTLGAMTSNQSEHGLDLANARTIVSFGAPLAEGWGTPLTMRRLLRGEGSELRLIQVEPLRSRTAEAADRWLPARPGTEAVLALGLAHVLIAESLVPAETMRRISDYGEYAQMTDRFTPDAVSKATGAAAADIVATAREMVQFAPAIVIAGEDAGGGRHDRTTEAAILGLNLLLGNVGMQGGVLPRPSTPAPFEAPSLAEVRELDQVPDHSVMLLLIDASAGDAPIPWAAVERKLVPKRGLVIALTPFFAGSARNADYIVPTAPFLEAVHEVPTPFDATHASLTFSAAMLPARESVRDPMAFLRTIAENSSIEMQAVPKSSEELMRARVAAVHAAATGTVTSFEDGSVKTLSEFGTPDELWEALIGGARWESDPLKPTPVPSCSLMAPAHDALGQLRPDAPGMTTNKHPLLLLPRATRDVASSAALSPVLTKLYQESGLRRAAGTIVVNPATARELGIRSGSKVRLETSAGTLRLRLNTGNHVMPGVIEANVGPDGLTIGDRHSTNGLAVLDIMPGQSTWRVAAARVVEG